MYLKMWLMRWKLCLICDTVLFSLSSNGLGCGLQEYSLFCSHADQKSWHGLQSVSQWAAIAIYAATSDQQKNQSKRKIQEHLFTHYNTESSVLLLIRTYGVEHSHHSWTATAIYAMTSDQHKKEKGHNIGPTSSARSAPVLDLFQDCWWQNAVINSVQLQQCWCYMRFASAMWGQ